MEQDYYTTKEAAQLTGASRQIVRTYTDRYARHFSTEATPGPGRPRRFTGADLKLIAFIYERTGAGAKHEEVAAELASGALDGFEWRPERLESAESAQDAKEGAAIALVPVERLQAAHALLQDARLREEEAREREDALQAEVARLRQDLGQAQGELSAYKTLRARRPRWWVWLFGE